MRKLVSVQKITDKMSIKDADKIEVVKILGWQCIVEKGKFSIGDKVLYFEIDSLLPELPEYEFLRNRSWINNQFGKGFRIRTIKLKGYISQGLVLSIPDEYKDCEVDTDMTEKLHVLKYDPIEISNATTKGKFPSELHKTDEIRIQTVPELIPELYKDTFYITLKMDGMSGTFFNINNRIGVCSRNLELNRNEKSPYWMVFDKYNLERILLDNNNLAIQGEVCGINIQKNPIGLSDIQLYVFDIYDILQQKYYDFIEFEDFCNKYKLTTVPIISINTLFSASISDEDIFKLSDRKYNNGHPAEGIVIRTMSYKYSDIIKGRYSFKVENFNYLLLKK